VRLVFRESVTPCPISGLAGEQLRRHLEAITSYRDQLCPVCGMVVPLVMPPCPRCSVLLTRREFSDIAIHDCTVCAGLFLDHHAIAELLADPEHGRIDALLGIPGAPSTALAPSETGLACPVCSDALTRRMSDSGAGTILDVCVRHGVYFDAGELQAILVFVRRTVREQKARAELEEEYRKQRG
jgi:Zn-finger nucleic acid-binding protein